LSVRGKMPHPPKGIFRKRVDHTSALGSEFHLQAVKRPVRKRRLKAELRSEKIPERGGVIFYNRLNYTSSTPYRWSFR
jgi:hypothetical protein